MSLASCVAVDKLCDSGQVVSLANCVALGKLCGGGQVVWSGPYRAVGTSLASF
jgi:hypothetical protein